MKYYETSKFSKAVGSAGFYTIIAVCLVAIGAITWFAVSRYNKSQNEGSPTPQISEPQNSVPDTTPPDTEPPVQSEPVSPNENVEVQNSQEQVPYEQETVEKPSVFLPPINGKTLKDFSDTALQYSATYGDMRLHKGVDIAADLGSEIKASADGRVSEIQDDALLGKCVTVEYAGGITVKYCGFDTLAITDGESVAQGRVLGTLGTVPSECADDSHIHIEVKKDGKSVPPETVFNKE